MHSLMLLSIVGVALAPAIPVVMSHPTPPPTLPAASLHPHVAQREPSSLIRTRLHPLRNEDQMAGVQRVEAIVLPGFANISIAADGATTNVTAVGQAFLYSPPPENDDDVMDPYEGLFNVFRAFDLSPEQEQRLVNRSYYFKVKPYEANQAQVQLLASQSSNANLIVPNVPDIQDPQPLPLNIAPTKSDADRPPESRLVVMLSDENNENGAVLVNHTFSDLPADFVPSEPVAEGLGSVLVPYQVAALQDGQQPIVDPQGGGG